MSFNQVDLYRQGFDTTYDIICDFIYDFIIILLLMTSQVAIIAWFYKNEQHFSEMTKQIETFKTTSNIRFSETSKQIESLESIINTKKIISDKNEQRLTEMTKQIETFKTTSNIRFSETSKQIESLESIINTNKIISDKNEQRLTEMTKQIETFKTTSNIRLTEMTKQIESLESIINTNKIISDKNEQRLTEMTKQIESLKTLSLFILFNDNEPTCIDVIKLFDEKDIDNLLEYYSCLKYYGFPRRFNVFIKIWLRYATEKQMTMIIPSFIKYNYPYEFDTIYDGRTKYYFNDSNFLRYFKDDTRGYGDSEELHKRISNAFLHNYL